MVIGVAVVARGVGCVALLALVGCGVVADRTPADDPNVTFAPIRDGGVDGSGDVDRDGSENVGILDLDGARRSDSNQDALAPHTIRIMTANISSGPKLDYGPIEGVHIFQGLHPDVALVQEFKSGTNTPAELDAYVATTFGPTFTYYREPGVDLPNGIVSRFPLAASGRWVDPQVSNRSFVYAKIAVPGSRPLWAVSVHLLTTGSSERSAEATALVAKVKDVVPDSDYLVIGGDFNTGGRNEACITTLKNIVVAAAPWPSDGAGGEGTSASRAKPFDWLLPDEDLAPLLVPTRIGQRAFPSGLVFDSRVYVPLADVAPVAKNDSASLNMQHMPVVRDFDLTE